MIAQLVSDKVNLKHTLQIPRPVLTPVVPREMLFNKLVSHLMSSALSNQELKS